METIETGVRRREIDGTHLQEPDRIVQSSILVEVGTDRDEVDVLVIVACDLYSVFTLMNQSFEIDPKRGIATLVSLYPFAIDLNGSLLCGSFKEQQQRTMEV